MPFDPQRVQVIFLQALELSAAARESFLTRECGADAALRSEVDALLAAHSQHHSLLDAPLVAPMTDARPGESTTAIIPESAHGELIAGRYKLLELIGEGGMGVVWMAEQRSPVKRLVALKLIKAGMDSRAVLARFEAERQALALMDHPSIARVLDGGVTDHGHPWFAMELVRGLPLAEYCDGRRLPIRARLELFIQVCSAAQHAHQKGIIHRDLKPSNILVTELDGQPLAKVIDFGLAKALGGSAVLTEHTLHTSYGAAVGTALYMAPEQVAVSALDVDTRADVYALGVVLYELLTGSTPVERGRLQEAAWDEMRRVIRKEEPPLPSMRISRSDALASIAAARHIDPAKLSGVIKGELDWIALKALEKDRNRRYDSASSFSADLQRYLDDEPVQAVPPSWSYRTRKFLRRHRSAVVSGGLVAVALALGLVAATWGIMNARWALNRETDAKRETMSARDEAEWNAYTSNLTLATNAMTLEDWPEARACLRSCPVSKRGWEWSVLNAEAGVVQAAVQGDWVAAAISPDQKIFALGNSEGIKIFDVSGKLIAAIASIGIDAGSEDSCDGSLRFNCDDNFLYCVSQNTLIRIDPRTHSHKAITIPGWQMVTLSGDGRRVAAIRAKKQDTQQVIGQFYSTENQAPVGNAVHLKDFAGPESWRKSLRANFRGTFCYCSGDQLWDIESSKLTDVKKEDAIAVQFDDPGESLVFFHADGRIRFLNLIDKKIDARFAESFDNADGMRLTGSLKNISSPLFVSPDRGLFNNEGQLCAVFGRTINFHESLVLGGHSAYSVINSYAGAMGSGDSLIRFVPLETTGSAIERFPSSEDFPSEHAPAFSALSRAAILGEEPSSKPYRSAPTIAADGHVEFERPGAGAETKRLTISRPATCCASSPDGSRVVTAKYNVIRFYETAEGRELVVLPQGQVVRNLEFVQDGLRLVVEFEDGSTELWDTRSIEERRKDWARRVADHRAAHQLVDRLIETEKSIRSIVPRILEDATTSPGVKVAAATLLKARISSRKSECKATMTNLRENEVYIKEMKAQASKLADPLTRLLVLDAIDQEPELSMAERARKASRSLWDKLCSTQLSSKQLQEAERLGEAMLHGDPDSIDVRQCYALLRFRLGHVGESCQLMQPLVNASRGVDADDWAAFGLMQVAAGKLDEARSSFASFVGEFDGSTTATAFYSEALYRIVDTPPTETYATIMSMGDIAFVGADEAQLLRAADEFRLGRFESALRQLDDLPWSRRLKAEDDALLYTRRLCFRSMTMHKLGRHAEAKDDLRAALHFWDVAEYSALQKEAANVVDPDVLKPVQWTPSAEYQAAAAIDCREIDEIRKKLGERITVKGFVARATPTAATAGANLFLNDAPKGLRLWLRFDEDKGLTPQLMNAADRKEVVVGGTVVDYETGKDGWQKLQIVPDTSADIQILGDL